MGVSHVEGPDDDWDFDALVDAAANEPWPEQSPGEETFPLPSPDGVHLGLEAWAPRLYEGRGSGLPSVFYEFLRVFDGHP